MRSISSECFIYHSEGSNPVVMMINITWVPEIYCKLEVFIDVEVRSAQIRWSYVCRTLSRTFYMSLVVLLGNQSIETVFVSVSLPGLPSVGEDLCLGASASEHRKGSS